MVWWKYAVVNILHIVWWMSDVLDAWCGGCLCGGCLVWWMSVCVGCRTILTDNHIQLVIVLCLFLVLLLKVTFLLSVQV